MAEQGFNNSMVGKYDDIVNRIGLQRKRYQNPGSADILCRFLRGNVLAWIAFERVKVESSNKYKPICQLQFNDHILRVDCTKYESVIERAMIRGICEVASHITKPCNIYVITDRILFKGIETEKPIKDEDLLLEACTAFMSRGCKVTEFVIRDGTELIYKYVKGDQDNTSEKKISECKTDTHPKHTNEQSLNEKSKDITHVNIEKHKDTMNAGSIVASRTDSKKKSEKEEHPQKLDGIRIQCRVCKRVFIMNESEIDFYKDKGFQLPHRCKECRAKGIRYSDDDYYDRGLKRNSYQQSLDIYGPRINVNGGLAESPGYNLVKQSKDKSTYMRSFGGKTEIIEKRHL